MATYNAAIVRDVPTPGVPLYSPLANVNDLNDATSALCTINHPPSGTIISTPPGGVEVINFSGGLGTAPQRMTVRYKHTATLTLGGAYRFYIEVSANAGTSWLTLITEDVNILSPIDHIHVIDLGPFIGAINPANLGLRMHHGVLQPIINSAVFTSNFHAMEVIRPDLPILSMMGFM